MQFADPEKNISHLTITEGMTIADFGTGAGHYAIALAKRVGPKGKVYAVDVQKDVLEHVTDAANRAGVGNVNVLWGTIDEVGGTKLRDMSCDAVVLASVLFQTDSKEATAKEVSRVLRPGGEVLLIDWRAGGIGAHHSQIISEASAKEVFLKAGFTFVSQFDAGSHHYGMIFKK